VSLDQPNGKDNSSPLITIQSNYYVKLKIRRLTMTVSKYWTPLTILLVVIIAIGGILAWSRYSASRPTEISIASNLLGEEPVSEIYIGGAVSNPGFYPLKASDSVETLIQAAGGTTTGADLNGVKLHITEVGDEEPSQRINLNRAEVWLLEALPGIGEERAKAIVAYRNQNEPLRNTSELIKVEGIGTKTYEQIKHLITVAD